MVSIQCDEHVKRSVIEGLRARGVDVHTAEEENIKGVPDAYLLDHCIRKKRVLLTNDSDFLDIIEGRVHPGIIFITSQFAPVGDIIRAVIILVDTMPATQFENSRLFVP